MTTVQTTANRNGGGTLKRGYTVLIRRTADRLVGEVISGGEERVAIQFPKPLPNEFHSGDQIEFHYWENRNTVHIFDAEVARLAGYGRQIETIIQGERRQERKHRRFVVPVTVFAKVVENANPKLVGQEFVCETENISIRGLLFESTLDLRVGDKLDLKLALGTDDDCLSTRAWVVRSRKIKRKQYVGTFIVKSSNAVALEFELFDEDQRRLFRFLLASSAQSLEANSAEAARTA